MVQLEYIASYTVHAHETLSLVARFLPGSKQDLVNPNYLSSDVPPHVETSFTDTGEVGHTSPSHSHLLLQYNYYVPPGIISLLLMLCFDSNDECIIYIITVPMSVSYNITHFYAL